MLGMYEKLDKAFDSIPEAVGWLKGAEDESVLTEGIHIAARHISTGSYAAALGILETAEACAEKLGSELPPYFSSLKKYAESCAENGIGELATGGSARHGDGKD